MILFLFVVIFAFSSVYLPASSYGWHDQQRICQLLFLLGAGGLSIALPRSMLPSLACLLIFGVLFLGLLASWQAAHLVWALKEWARYVGLVVGALLLGGLVRRQMRVADALLWVMVGIGAIHAFQFLSFYVIAFVSGVRLLDADLLFDGFSNPRFFGQFQVMLMPVLAMLAVRSWFRGRVNLARLLFIVLTVQWCIAFMLGGRGLWLALGVSHVAICMLGRRHWLGVMLQLAAVAFGFVLFSMLFLLVPSWLDIEPTLRDGLRVGLSAREHVWHLAWESALDHPWFGVGPMHFSAAYNPVAAHPHQAILQWLAEWGFPATLLTIALAVWGIIHGAARLQAPETDALDAGVWLAISGSLVLAQVDGVFVMPYTETWLAILVGLAIGRWSTPSRFPGRWQKLLMNCFLLPALLVLGRALLLEAPELPAAQRAYLEQHPVGWAPRFWSQGWIPMDSIAEDPQK